MTTIEVLSVTKDTIVKTGERFLNVKAQIVDGKKKHPRNYAYPIDTPKKVIEKELANALDLYEQEKAQAAANEEADKAEAGADKTIEALEGATISNE